MSLHEEGQLSTNLIELLATAVLYLVIFVSGYWLSHAGKPRHAAILTIHKLVSLAAVVLLGVVAYETNHTTGLAAIEWAAVGAAGAFFLGTMASGGLASVNRPMPRAVLTLHRITPFLTALATAAALYLLLGRS